MHRTDGRIGKGLGVRPRRILGIARFDLKEACRETSSDVRNLHGQVIDRSAIEVSMAPPGLPFAHLNLRRNPFGEIDRRTWAELAVVDVTAFVRRLAELDYAVQFLGEKGRGKTTHMLAILRHFPQAAYVHLPEDRQPPIPRGRPLLIDELQRLSRWRRRLLYRRKSPLVIGTPIDYAQELRRAGYDTYACEVVMDRVERTFSYSFDRDDRFRNGRTVLGKLAEGDHAVSVHMDARRNEQIDALRPGDVLRIECRPLKWNLVYNRLEACEV